MVLGIHKIHYNNTVNANGNMQKYDCSSADINPIGGISKTDLKLFIAYAQEAYNLPVLYDFIHAVPTAELEPISTSLPKLPLKLLYNGAMLNLKP